jgi:hypothetical protein
MTWVILFGLVISIMGKKYGMIKSLMKIVGRNHPVTGQVVPSTHREPTDIGSAPTDDPDIEVMRLIFSKNNYNINIISNITFFFFKINFQI